MLANFGPRLKAARTMAGLSMDALVEKLDKQLSKQAISKYENGLMSPDSSNLILLANILNVGVDYFFAENEINITEINFRKKASLGKKAVESLKERVKDAVERYLQLETLVQIDSKFKNPLHDFLVKDAQDIENAAKDLRKAWGIGPDLAVSPLIDLLEEHLVKVIELDEQNEFDGLSGWVGDIPIIVLNKNAPNDRKRLTALHEFAHLALRFDPSLEESKQEKLCHSFGGAFLLPELVLKRELGPKRSELSFGELKSLKEQYGISMQAIVYRAKYHAIVSEHLYERMSIEFSRRGWRKEEPVHYAGLEESHRFLQLLFRALAEEIISVSKASYLSKLDIPEIERRFSLSDEVINP